MPMLLFFILEISEKISVPETPSSETEVLLAKLDGILSDYTHSQDCDQDKEAVYFFAMLYLS